MDVALVELLEARVESLVDSTFYGVAKIRAGGHEHEIDARSSDVLALAVRVGCPIYASEEVLEQAGVRVRMTGAFKTAAAQPILSSP